MRVSAEVGMEALKQTVAQSQREVNKSLGELQDMVIAQREATHSLEKEVLAYKLETESKLTEDAKRLAAIDRQVAVLGGSAEPSTVPDPLAERIKVRASRTCAAALDALSPRPLTQEVELALLNERELRKMVEIEVNGLKSKRNDLSLEVQEQLAALRAEVQGTPGGGAIGGGSDDVRVVDEKVKECAKLIVRMGSELMEETRRRQRIEEELAGAGSDLRS